MKRAGSIALVGLVVLAGCSSDPCADASCTTSVAKVELAIEGASFQALGVTGCDKHLRCLTYDASMRCARFSLWVMASGACHVAGVLADGRSVESTIVVGGHGGDACCGQRLEVEGAVALVVK